MSAQICPVCGGSGQYAPPQNPAITATEGPRLCHGCGGRGWVDASGTCLPCQPYSPYLISPDVRHRRVETTVRYMHLADDDVAEAMRKIAGKENSK